MAVARVSEVKAKLTLLNLGSYNVKENILKKYVTCDETVALLEY
jgi:hypothetical protein